MGRWRSLTKWSSECSSRGWSINMRCLPCNIFNINTTHSSSFELFYCREKIQNNTNFRIQFPFLRLPGRPVWEGTVEGPAHRLWEVHLGMLSSRLVLILSNIEPLILFWYLPLPSDPRQNRPVLNESSPLVLTFGVTLQQIIDVVRRTL